jgi:hypothetical protein
MASLRSILVHRNQFASLPGLLPDEDGIELQYVSIAKNLLGSRETILVNATNVAKDVPYLRGESFDAGTIPCPKPPFHKMWLEVNLDEAQTGCLVQRIDVPDGKDPVETFARCNVAAPVEFHKGGSPVPDAEEMLKKDAGAFIEGFAQAAKIYQDSYKLDVRNLKTNRPYDLIAQDRPATIIHASVWISLPHLQAVAIIGNIYYWLDKDAVVINCDLIPWPPEHEHTLEACRLGGPLAWMLHTFARLNCHNVKLVPRKAGAPSPKALRKHHRPETIWHEIVVEQIQVKTKGNTAPSGEKQELRFHRVRGHYADYTKGAGLFGKYKVRIWVEEHARGNPELGEVVASYTVQ